MHKSIAIAALQLLKQARVSVDDQQLVIARQVRAWLNGVVTGALTVSVTPEPDGEKQVEAGGAIDPTRIQYVSRS